jgi:hypothetical protein
LSSLIAPEDLDATLDSDVPIVLVLENVDNDTTARLRRRQPLLLIDLETCDMADLVEALRPHIQTLIDRLIRAPDLHIGDDLQQVLDLGLYNPRLGSLFETLWVARFEHAEQRDRDRSVRDLLRATFEDPSPLVRNDALLFWLTLLRQNVASTTGQVLLLLTNPAGLDEPLAAFIRSAEHWATLGSPVRVVTDLATVS